ncbi:MAG TPA: type II secretion system protein [Candidatus Paceibacterota bacterium]|jgi:prepilin-type N-terminal cleavage/methylation domain-containing protein
MHTPSLRRGFTLIELLVVIAIIGVLSAVVLSSVNVAREKSLDARRLADIHQVQLALELYADAHSGNYPIISGSYLEELKPILAPAYIPAVPEDPRRVAPYTYRYYSGDGNGYTILIDLYRDGNNGFCKINYGTPWSGFQVYPSC